MPEKKNQYIDIHCHILPEVDDGARNLEESLAMLRQEVKQGMEAVILTPHQKPNRPSITAASVLERTQKLQQAATENGIDIRLYSGGEIFRSGCCFYRGNGKIFYFQPGHETVPVFKNENVQTVIKNAICWAAPTARFEIKCSHIKKIGSEE